MKKNFKEHILVCMLLLSNALVFSQGYTIKGELKGAAGKKIFLVEDVFYKTEFLKDSTRADAAGRFSFSGKLKEPSLYRLDVEGIGEVDNRFIVENSNMTLKGTVDSLRNLKVLGSAETLVWKEMDKTFHRLNEERLSIISKIEKAKSDRDSLTFVKYVNAMDSLRFEIEPKVWRPFFKRNKESLAGIMAFAQFSGYDDETYNSYLKTLEESKVSNYTVVKYLRNRYDSDRKFAPGVIAPDFTQKDINGHPVTLSSFKGKYVFLEFWASWCGPCRQENPNLVKAYNTYKDKNFTILSVSLDEKAKAWKDAIKADGLPWIHVSDLQGWDNDVAKRYLVTSVPKNYLLGPDGIILATNLRGEELASKLEELLGTSKQ